MTVNELYDYILSNFEDGEPVFLSEVPGASDNAKRQSMKRLVDDGRMKRFSNGVYYRPYEIPIRGVMFTGLMDTERLLEKKYIKQDGKIVGYRTGIEITNKYGFTSQNSGVIEIASNLATTKERRFEIKKRRIFLYKPYVEVTDENVSALRFLDLMLTIDRYSEVRGERMKKKLREFIEWTDVNFDQVKKCISAYPTKVYRNMDLGGVLDVLV